MGLFLFFWQHVAMNKKHALEAFRSPRSTLIQLFVPIIITLIFWGVVRHQLAPPDSSSNGLDFSLPPLHGDGHNPIVYWPQSLSTWNIMNQFANSNNMKIAPFGTPLDSNTNGKYDVIAFRREDYAESKPSTSYSDRPTPDTLAVEGLRNKGFQATVGVSFENHRISYGYYGNYEDTTSLPLCFGDPLYNTTRCIDYAVLSNNTFSVGRYRSGVSLKLNEAILKLNQQAVPNYKFSTNALPNGASSFSIIAQYLETTLLGIVCTFSFIFIFSNIAAEAESGMRGYLKTMGLIDWVYWSSWYLHHFILFAIPISVVLILGYTLSGFHVFRSTEPSLMVFLVFSYGVSAIAWASAWTAVLKKTRIATVFGYFMFIIAVIFSFMFFVPQLVFILEAPAVKAKFNMVIAFFMVPTWHFLRVLSSIQLVTTGGTKGAITGTNSGTVFGWDTLKQEVPWVLVGSGQLDGSVDHTPAWSLGMIWVNTFVYLFLMWYCDKVFPDQKKSTYVPWFFVLPSFWGLGGRGRRPQNQFSMHNIVPPNDPDLRMEMESAGRGDTDLSIQGVRKEYKSFGCLGGKVALRDFYLTANQGTIVALLGHNGAGKTTLINILTGKTNQTSGDAFLLGDSVAYDMDRLQSSMGICPQFDVLWGDLTAQEHMSIMSAIKPGNDDTDQILSRVKLADVTSISSKFSGGMKRRLQVAISILGGPRILFLDEPTTGMDPVNRRKVWDLIRDIKQDKLIFLTTHAMEEAEVLGEKIAVLQDGELRSIGSALHLKNKYATGYRLNVICMDQCEESVRYMVAQGLPQARLAESNSNNLIFLIQNVNDSNIGAFLQQLELVSKASVEAQIERGLPAQPALVRDWGLSNSTLEDVFLTVTRSGHAGRM